VLERHARRIPLGIVTGRPRADAEWFLRDAGIGDLFRVAVCMEDAPPKPDPSPVVCALERMGVTDAWMVGDTPDDIVAARGARVVPIGIAAPGIDVGPQRLALERVGAARVLDRLSDVERILS
jgi:phosphoglycolate phosphatase-like HAD superfamily hydrolase